MTVVVIGLVVIVVWIISLVVKPYGRCGRCDGTGRKGRRGSCPRCGGTGRKPRVGVRSTHRGVVTVINARRERRSRNHPPEARLSTMAAGPLALPWEPPGRPESCSTGFQRRGYHGWFGAVWDHAAGFRTQLGRDIHRTRRRAGIGPLPTRT